MAKGVTNRLKAVLNSTEPEVLLAGLNDRSNLVVEAAARKLTITEAVPALVQTYERLEAKAPKGDPACRGRTAILRTLGEMQASEAAPFALRAIRAVQIERLEDTAVDLRSTAAGVLGILNPPGGLLELACLLNDMTPNVRDMYEKMGPRMAAARALAATGELTAMILLTLKLRLPNSELPEVLAECMDGLVQFDDPSIVETLLPYVKHDDPYLVAAAATNLARLLKDRAVPHFLEALPTAPQEAKPALVYSLASIRGNDAKEALQNLADHPDASVRRAAKECL